MSFTHNANKNNEDKQMALIPYDPNNTYVRMLKALDVSRSSIPRSLSYELINSLCQDENPLKRLHEFKSRETNVEILFKGPRGIQYKLSSQKIISEKDKCYLKHTRQALVQTFAEILPLFLYQVMSVSKYSSGYFDPEVVNIILSYVGQIESFYEYQHDDKSDSTPVKNKTAMGPSRR